MQKMKRYQPLPEISFAGTIEDHAGLKYSNKCVDTTNVTLAAIKSMSLVSLWQALKNLFRKVRSVLANPLYLIETRLL